VPTEVEGSLVALTGIVQAAGVATATAGADSAGGEGLAKAVCRSSIEEKITEEALDLKVILRYADNEKLILFLLKCQWITI
jgi:hypothetical protein